MILRPNLATSIYKNTVDNDLNIVYGILVGAETYRGGLVGMRVDVQISMGNSYRLATHFPRSDR